MSILTPVLTVLILGRYAEFADAFPKLAQSGLSMTPSEVHLSVYVCLAFSVVSTEASQGQRLDGCHVGYIRRQRNHHCAVWNWHSGQLVGVCHGCDANLFRQDTCCVGAYSQVG